MTGVEFKAGRDRILLCNTRDLLTPHQLSAARVLLEQGEADDPDGYAEVLELARVGTDPDDTRKRERLVQMVASGALVFVKIREDPRILDAPKSSPLIPTKPTGPTITRPTWISLEVVAEDGIRVPGLGVTIEFPDGSQTFGRLDADSRWRADDVPTRGDCAVALDKIAVDWSTRPIAPASQGEWFDALEPRPLRLRTEHHHRLVAVAGRTEVRLLDALGNAAGGTKYSVDVGGRTIEGRTDSVGSLAVVHPRAASRCVLTYPDFDASPEALDTAAGRTA